MRHRTAAYPGDPDPTRGSRVAALELRIWAARGPTGQGALHHRVGPERHDPDGQRPRGPRRRLHRRGGHAALGAGPGRRPPVRLRCPGARVSVLERRARGGLRRSTAGRAADDRLAAGTAERRPDAGAALRRPRPSGLARGPRVRRPAVRALPGDRGSDGLSGDRGRIQAAARRGPQLHGRARRPLPAPHGAGPSGVRPLVGATRRRSVRDRPGRDAPARAGDERRPLGHLEPARRAPVARVPAGSRPARALRGVRGDAPPDRRGGPPDAGRAGGRRSLPRRSRAGAPREPHDRGQSESLPRRPRRGARVDDAWRTRQRPGDRRVTTALCLPWLRRYGYGWRVARGDRAGGGPGT